MKSLCKLLLASFIFGATLSAQGEEEVNLDFSLLLWPTFSTISPDQPEPEEPVFWYPTSSGQEAVEPIWNISSETLKYRGLASATFSYRLQSDTDEPTYRPAFNIRWPERAKEVLLIVFIQKNGALRAFPIDVSPRLMPPDSIQMINISGKSLAAQIGDTHNKVIENGGSWVVSTGTRSSPHLSIKLAEQDDENWRMFYRSALIVGEEGRSVVLIHKDRITEGSTRLRTIALGETVPDEPEILEVGPPELFEASEG